MVTFISKDNRIDLLIDNRQKIIDTLKIMEERGELFTAGADKEQYVKSLRRNRRISFFFSYEEMGIYSGDTLEICNCNI